MIKKIEIMSFFYCFFGDETERKTACCRKEYSEENLLFWTACENARLMEDDLEFLQQVKIEASLLPLSDGL
jgi:hypothetical protein